MKKIGKVLGFVGVTLMATSLLTACGSSKDGASGEKDGKVTLRISWWGNDDRHKATNEAIKKFQEKYPDIKVKAEYSGWDGIVEKMAT